MMEEIWKDIKGLEGFYQISNYGRLKSYKSDPNGTILSNVNSKGDYLSVVLQKDRTHKKYTRIHRLVAEHFIPKPATNERLQVHHKDGNKQNNHVDNLEWITAKDHYKESLKQHPQIVTGMVHYNQFERPNPVCQYTLDGKFLAEYYNARIAGEFTGVCSRNILQVASQEEYKPGKTRKQAGGYIWRFKGGDANEVVRTG